MLLGQLHDRRNLNELRARLAGTASANQTRFSDLRGAWVELNLATGNEQAQRALDLYNQGHRIPRTGSSVPLLESARQIDLIMGWVSNDIAWALSTDPDPEQRDPAVAILRAVEACEDAKWQYWGFLDTLAASLAADGRHEAAVRVAEAALARAPVNERPQLEFAIDRYKRGLAWEAMKP
jgi:hypothetical protein